MKILPIHIKRFWEKVYVKDENDCWLWIGGQSKGYGTFWVTSRNYGAHVISFRIANPNINIVGEILHTCDNKICVNPKHLTIGSHSQNMKDAALRGQIDKGEDCHNARFSEENILEIRRMFTTGYYSINELAERWHTTRRAIQLIVYRQKWKHI